MDRPKDIYKYLFDPTECELTVRHYIPDETFNMLGKQPYVESGKEDSKREYLPVDRIGKPYAAGAYYCVLLEEGNYITAAQLLKVYLNSQVVRNMKALENSMKRLTSLDKWMERNSIEDRQ